MRCRGRASAATLAGIIGVLVGAAVVWVMLRGGALPAPPTSRQTAAPATAVPAFPAVSRESQDAITAAIAAVGPAVVNISAFLRPEDPLERVLREMVGERFPPAGQGSGVIIDGGRGYILTNAHVVKRAAAVEVALADGRELRAETVGLDPLTDVAVLRVPGGDLPDAALGGAADLPIGSWVIAIGNPFGYANSVTVGVISAKDRQIRGDRGTLLDDLLQTDAAINPGNSGGALVDLNGNVVGIPTAIAPYAQGIGFAISADVARQVADRLIATGKMPWLGITHRDLLPAERRSLRAPEGRGTLAIKVVQKGPAYRAGIRPGDVIVQVGDTPLANAKALGAAVREYSAGDRVTVKVWREGRELSLRVRLGEVPTESFG